MAYSTITKPADYFNTITYTGNNTAGNAITGVGFRPEFFWTKSYDQVQSHLLFDFVRGTEKFLKSDSTGAEDTQSGTVTSFDSDGVTFGASSAGNASGYNYVAWNWLAGGTASSNTDGTITSSVSANTTAGFSIATFTYSSGSPTIGHGLGVEPSVVIVKNRTSTANNWNFYHKSLGATKALYLNGTNAATTSSLFWNDTAPTSSVFTVSSNLYAADHVAYCFAEKKGYSKFGSYTGNGSADGTFVYTGFKPAFIIAKETNEAGDNWVMFDNKRDGYNVNNDELYPNLTNAEADGATYVYVDLLSNGFKWRTTASNKNQSGSTYIYMAFAENPLVANTGGGIPATAR